MFRFITKFPSRILVASRATSLSPTKLIRPMLTSTSSRALMTTQHHFSARLPVTTSQTTPPRRFFAADSALVESIVDKGVERLSLGDFDGAVKFFDEALQQDSTNARALMNRAVALHNTGRRVESDPLWAQLLKRSTGEARFEGMCYYHMGTSLSEDKEYERAVDVLQRGLAAMDAGSTEPGYESATAVVRGRLHCALGFALGSLGRLNDAERAWQEGARVSPAHVDNVISLAHHYFNVKRYDEAVPWYERAMQLNTASMRIVTDYALCLASMGRFGDVERLHEHCLKVGNAVSAACSQHRTLAE